MSFFLGLASLGGHARVLHLSLTRLSSLAAPVFWGHGALAYKRHYGFSEAKPKVLACLAEL